MDENKLKNITHADIFAAKELLREVGYTIVEPIPFLKSQQIIWWLCDDPQSIVPVKVIEVTENGYESTPLCSVLTVKLVPLGFVSTAGQQLEIDISQKEDWGVEFFPSFNAAVDYYLSHVDKRREKDDN